MPTMFTRGIRLEVAQDVLGALIAHGAEAAAPEHDCIDPVKTCSGVTVERKTP
jgi:hypothetical protein